MTAAADSLKLQTVEPGSAELAALFQRLGRFNKAAVPEWSKQTVAVVAHEGGELVAGAHAEILLGLAEIRAVWVEEGRRGTGLGRRTMAAIEQAARQRGATRAFLYTYSFQALGFYEKLGYRLLASLSFPQGNVERHYMTREL